MQPDAVLSAPRSARNGAIASLGTPSRVWAVGSIYGRYGALCQLHEAMAKQLKPEDRIVYLGNYLGATSQWSGEGKAVLSELTGFRNAVTSTEDFEPSDIVYLRGQIEDLCRQMLRLPFHKDAMAWATMALEKGLGAWLAAYSVNPQALTDAAEAGPFVANRFTYYWQRILSGHAEHEEFLQGLKDAAHTENPKPLAFIPEGLDPRLPLNSQHALLCWPESDIAGLGRYFSYARVVRGAGTLALEEKHFVLTLDGGNRLDSALHAVCLDATGRVIESLTF